MGTELAVSSRFKLNLITQHPQTHTHYHTSLKVPTVYCKAAVERSSGLGALSKISLLTPQIRLYGPRYFCEPAAFIFLEKKQAPGRA